MASGDEVFRTGTMKVVKLLDAVVATSTNVGVWVDCGDYNQGTVVTRGATGAAVTDVEAFNDNVAGGGPPTNATAGPAIQTAGAATDIFVSIPVLPRWIKATITILGTGTVTSVLVARKTSGP